LLLVKFTSNDQTSTGTLDVQSHGEENVYSSASDSVSQLFYILKPKYLEFADSAIRTHVRVPRYTKACNDRVGNIRN